MTDLGRLCGRWRAAFAVEIGDYGLDDWVRRVDLNLVPANKMRENDAVAARSTFRNGASFGPAIVTFAALRKQLDVVVGRLGSTTAEYRFNRDDTLYGYITNCENGHGPKRKRRSKIHWYPDRIDENDGWPRQAPLIFAAVEVALHETAERIALADVGPPRSQSDDGHLSVLRRARHPPVVAARQVDQHR